MSVKVNKNPLLTVSYGTGTSMQKLYNILFPNILKNCITCSVWGLLGVALLNGRGRVDDYPLRMLPEPIITRFENRMLSHTLLWYLLFSSIRNLF